MYVKTSVRKTKNGEVRYLQLAHNEWDAEKGRSVPRVIYGFGREDQLDKDAVRRLVTSLSRLRYTGGDRTGARHDRARIKGVSTAGAAALAATVAAVLGRDLAAVASMKASLVGRRDAASGTLAFEFAARLQQEIEALDWVTAEQKVTRPDNADHNVCAWSDGLLVSFAVRGGCLVGWT